jgi:PAS domain S-box-containing protein
MENLDDWFDASTDLLAVVDAGGKFVRVSRSWQRLFEPGPVPPSYLECLHPDDRSLTRDRIAGLAAGTANIEFENRVIGANGTVRPFAWAASTIRDQPYLFLSGREVHSDVYRSIVENAVDGIFQSTVDGRFLRVNASMADLYGYATPTELVAAVNRMDEQLFVEPERRRQLLDELNRNGRVKDFQSRVYRKDGSIIWISEDIRMVTGPDGAALYLEGVTRNITEQKQAEIALAASELRYAMLTESMSEGLLVVDNDDRILHVNSRICDMLGYSAGELIGQIAKDILLTSDNDRKLLEEKNRSRKSGVRDRYEMMLRRKSGEWLWAMLGGAPMYGADGTVVGSVGIVTDISERKAAETALRVSEKKLHDLVVYSAGYICTHDLDGIFLSVNPSACARLGYSADEMIGQPIELFVWPDRRSMVTAYLEELKVNDIASGYIKFSTKHGEPVVWSYTNRVLRDAGETAYVIGYAQDVTEKLALEKEKEKLIEELKKTLSEIKVLSGMLPICASCKKIKDDHGYWHQIEAYISTHSAAQFTHGLCLDCQHRLYPELFKPGESGH